MESSELGKVPRKDDKRNEISFETLASELLRPPEGSFEVLADDQRDVTPMTESTRRAKMENEKIVNGAVSTEPDEVKKPDVGFEHLSTPKIGLESMLLTDGETSSALATGGINSELIQEMDRDKKMEVKTLSEILSCWESSRKQLY